ncbi:MAG: 3-isopropylmalate dehydratase small subunit [Rickettsiales bacterium]|jgi:3-isopropylmalate/(R)-2-methylmalate dehydratase small subunit|nr:3-isopropylmalate dehydratase small subunit [Rickettsiales bacterium]
MKKLDKVEGVITAISIDNIDTDMIIPKQFLQTIKKTGLGAHLFYEMRFDLKGNEVTDFILNKSGYKDCQILVAGDNFGCGSSREHAPWAISDFGINVIIAPSFADIFYNNCFKNAILPITLNKEQIARLTDYANDGINQILVNLPDQSIAYGNNIINFEIEPFRKKCLIEGLDDISLTLQSEDKIAHFEAIQRQESPWLYSKRDDDSEESA